MANLKYIGKNILNHDLILKKGDVSGSNASSASFGHINISNNASVDGNLVVDGRLTAQEIHTEIESASIIFTSGSTLFGNTPDDTHIFTGSLLISGSISAPNLIADSASFSTRITTDSSSFSTRTTTLEAASASFSTRVTTAETELEETIISASAQLAEEISGSFTAPSASFSTRITNFSTGNVELVSGSATSTGSFGRVEVEHIHSTDDISAADDITAGGRLVAETDAKIANIITLDANGISVGNDTRYIRVGSDSDLELNHRHPQHTSPFRASTNTNIITDKTNHGLLLFGGNPGIIMESAVSASEGVFLSGSRANIELRGGNVSGSATSTGSFGFITGSKIQGTFLGDGNSLDLSSNSTIGSNIFSTVAVAGQSNIVADSNSDTLTLAESTGLGITTNAGSDTVTFALDTAQTSIQTIFNTALVVGRASGDTTIDFTADDVIVFDAGSTERMRVDSSGVDITGALTVSTNTTIQGDLVVNGSTTTLSTTNLAVGDQFIFAATGSAGGNVDAGLVVQSGSAVNTGSAFYHDINSQRWAVAKTVASNAVAVTPNQFITTVTLNSSPPSDSNGEYGVGEMWVETDTQDIFIRTN